LKSLTPSDFRAIILASGKGTRFGMPKSEAKIDGLLFSQKISQSLLESGVRDIVLAEDLDTSSMYETLQETIRKEIKAPPYYIVWPVDHPLVSSTSISLLIEGAIQNPDCIIKPEFRGKRGHPVLLPSTLDFLSPLYETLRELIRHSGKGTVILPVEDPGVILNINRPQDMDFS
jgi:CTP:molybdopterin cytidylyltransferase MocA